MNINKSRLLVLAISFTVLAGCESDKTETLQDSIVESTAISNFDPANSVIPYPNDLLFAGMVDGTINIPVADASDLSDPQVAINGLDGFSTVAPITTGFTGPIGESSLSGDSIKLYEVTLSTGAIPGGAAVAVDATLTYGVDYLATVSSVDSSGATLAILPLQPLKPKTSYYVAITNSLKSSDGNQMGVSGSYIYAKQATPLVDGGGVSQFAGLTDAEAAALEPLRQLVSTSEGFVSAADATLDAADIILGWSFTTQSISDVLVQVRADIGSGSVPASAIGDSGVESALGAADIWVGTIDVPYYLAKAANVNDSTPLDSYWNGLGRSHLTYIDLSGAGGPAPRLSPVATSTESIPLMVSVPKLAKPASGYPVVIYQHGITTNRATMLALADAFGSVGIAVVAIDMPLHGLTGNETDGTENFFEAAGASERTFNLDLVDNVTGAAGPDGVTDTSGKHYINLTNLLNTRDNFRQSVSDLFALAYAIDSLSIGGGATDFDQTKIYFLGHSLGAMVGTTFAALEPDVRDAVFAFGGGMIPKILDGSASFSPSIVAGLAASGVVKGTADYESFFGAAQTVTDSGDPVNYATTLATKPEGILYLEIQGSNASPSDLVVPNTVPDGNDSSGTVPAPLSGTEPMLTLLGLTQVNSDQIGTDLKHSVKFAVGNHGSLLSAAADDFNSEETNTKVRTEIQTLAVTFLASGGSAIDVADDTLLNAP
ncbi:MAG: lipase [Aestuariibacter sp.]|nr:lipase [Aestuariibacter sp.]